MNDGVALETQNMTIYSVILVIVTLACLALSLWYARKLGDMLGKMAKHAQKLQVKSMELSNEKKRADTLLCQMLPREVAEQLKMNREVKAERFSITRDQYEKKKTRTSSSSFGIGNVRSRLSSLTASQSSSVTSLDSPTSLLAAVLWKWSTC